MNIDYANSIPLRVILAKMGSQPRSSIGRELNYRSPLDPQKNSILIVDTETNVWRDIGLQVGGNVVQLVCAYLKATGEHSTMVDALRWIKNMVGYAVLIPPSNAEDHSLQDSLLSLVDVEHISSLPLIEYLEDMRKIPFDYARFVLKEVTVLNSKSGNYFKALGLQNEEKGFAIRNPFVKAQVKPAAVSFMRGQVVKPSGIHIFKDVLDYLSLISYRSGDPLTNDALILNSLKCMPESAAYIRHYGYSNAFTWLDNDIIGDAATRQYARFLKTEPNLRHVRMNKIYDGFKDMNEWWASEGASKSKN
ncbi:MAG: toprim domain-containing protein [Bacteroidetes bacterium]|nr:toprim domain-containing protein [Bacteroidota bacterium]